MKEIIKTNFKVIENASNLYNSFISKNGELTEFNDENYESKIVEILNNIENNNKKDEIRIINRLKVIDANIEFISRFKSQFRHHSIVKISHELLPDNSDFNHLIGHCYTCNEKSVFDRRLEGLHEDRNNLINDLEKIRRYKEIKDYRSIIKRLNLSLSEYLIMYFNYIIINNGYLIYNSEVKLSIGQVKYIGDGLDYDKNIKDKFILIQRSKDQVKDDYACLKYIISSRNRYLDNHPEIYRHAYKYGDLNIMKIKFNLVRLGLANFDFLGHIHLI